MMAAMGKEEGRVKAGGEEEKLLMDEVTVLDLDILRSTIAMHAEKGGLGKLNGEKKFVSDYTQYGGGVFRMWEGELVRDCLNDGKIAIQSTCCPCYRFGKNMQRAGFGSSFLQGSIYLILVVIAMSNLLAFMITRSCCFLCLAIASTASGGIYVGYYRTQIRKKFKIQSGESFLDDCVFHLICPCCTLCQESRTLEMNNVQDGIWQGRGETVCTGSFYEDNKPSSLLIPPSVVSTKSPDSHSI
ncbi:protein PLANT CADMIUM RESISTANCE 4 [Sesamum indicum]|uniref:Protein PLANT CADMIUM RESISTANCE 4 n=1 Tax=Sesamum indicum TaxID=4182 RepID=A0A6I9TL37_SESIN|nr:protein PLANT CADMIUM RESISTANCE 4 [Sesamum indicum]